MNECSLGASDMDGHDMALLLRKQQGQAEVCYLGFQTGVQQNVARFDVAVDDSLGRHGVKVMQAVSYSAANTGSLLPTHEVPFSFCTSYSIGAIHQRQIQIQTHSKEKRKCVLGTGICRSTNECKDI